MNEIGYYGYNNGYKLFLDFHKFGNDNYAKHLQKFKVADKYKLKYLFVLKIQCYSKEMFDHFVNAWNLDRTKFAELDWNADKHNLILCFKGEWHEARQFLIIVEKYLNDKSIELTLDRKMIDAILMMKELGR